MDSNSTATPAWITSWISPKEKVYNELNCSRVCVSLFCAPGKSINHPPSSFLFPSLLGLTALRTLCLLETVILTSRQFFQNDANHTFAQTPYCLGKHPFIGCPEDILQSPLSLYQCVLCSFWFYPQSNGQTKQELESALEVLSLHGLSQTLEFLQPWVVGWS